MAQPTVAAAPDRSRPPAGGELAPFSVATPRELKLKNGMRVWFVQRDRAPLVDVVAVVDASAAADPADRPGLASFTAGMLTQGAGALDAIAFANARDALGAELGAFTTAFASGLALHVESSRFTQGLALFALALTEPRFTTEDWQRVRDQTAGDFLVMAQEPQMLAHLAALRATWGPEHRFGKHTDGTPAALMATTAQELRAFHSTHYRPDTTTLIVVGDLTLASARQSLERAFSRWNASGTALPPVTLSAPLVFSKRRLVTVHIPDAAQTALRLVHPAPHGLVPWTADVEVMNTLLGGSFTSRLNTNLREQHGYAYGARSGIDWSPAGNVFSVRTSVATAVTVPAVAEIVRELERMDDEATPDEVNRARGVTALTLPAEFDSGRNVALLWASVAARRIDPTRIVGFMSRAAAVDVHAVRDAAQRVLRAEAVTLVAVGDMDKVGHDLEQFGPRTTWTAADLLPGLDMLTTGAKDSAPSE